MPVLSGFAHEIRLNNSPISSRDGNITLTGIIILLLVLSSGSLNLPILNSFIYQCRYFSNLFFFYYGENLMNMVSLLLYC